MLGLPFLTLLFRFKLLVQISFHQLLYIPDICIVYMHILVGPDAEGTWVRDRKYQKYQNIIVGRLFLHPKKVFCGRPCFGKTL